MAQLLITPTRALAPSVTTALLLLTFATTSLVAQAAEAPDASQTESEPAPAETRTSNQSANSDSDRVLTDAEKRRAGDKGGVFRPSEEISEDFALTFPVDI